MGLFVADDLTPPPLVVPVSCEACSMFDSIPESGSRGCWSHFLRTFQKAQLWVIPSRFPSYCMVQLVLFCPLYCTKLAFKKSSCALPSRFPHPPKKKTCIHSVITDQSINPNETKRNETKRNQTTMETSIITQYVRAGACTQGTILGLATEFTCAITATDCLPGQMYWSSQQLAEELAAPAADCLTAASTNLALGDQCEGSTTDLKVGACLVDSGSIIQCAASEQGCEALMPYAMVESLMSNDNIQCLLCGLDSSMDSDFSDLLPNGSVTPTTTSAGGDPSLGGGTTEFGATEAADPSIGGTTEFGATTPADPSGIGGTTAAAEGLDGDADGADGDDGADGEDGEDGDDGTDYYDYNDPQTTDATEPYNPYDPMGTGATTAAAGEYPGYETDPTTAGYGDEPDMGDSGDDGSSSSSDGTMKNSTNLYDEFENLDETQKMEAAAVFGIVVGILVGCCLLLWLQRQWRKYCSRHGTEKHNGRHLVGDEMGHVTSDDEDDLEDRML